MQGRARRVLAIAGSVKSRDEAIASWRELIAGNTAMADKVNATTNVRQLAAPEGAVNINMGTLVGSYASVARMLDEMAEVPNTGGVLLTFDDFIEGVEAFGRRIQPLMKSREGGHPAYAARHIAKNLVAAGVAEQVLVQVAYAIGVAQPVGVFVTTYGTTKSMGANGKVLSDGEIAGKVNKLFDLRPYAIVQRFGLQNPIFGQTAAYGHMGRQPGTVDVKMPSGETKTFETFTWEKLDYVPQIKTEFGL